MDKRESGKFPDSERRILMTHMVGQSIDVLNKQNNLGFKSVRKAGMVRTADGSGDEDVTLEGLKLPYTLMGVEKDGEEKQGTYRYEVGSSDEEGESGGRGNEEGGERRNRRGRI